MVIPATPPVNLSVDAPSIITGEKNATVLDYGVTNLKTPSTVFARTPQSIYWKPVALIVRPKPSPVIAPT
jgi:hypothetical protein